MKVEMMLCVHCSLSESCENRANDAGQNLKCYRRTDSKFVFIPLKE
jgi:hypothetical protein